MKNERGKIFTTIFQQVAGAPDTLHIYIDGLLMARGGKAARHFRIPDLLWRFILNGKPMSRYSGGKYTVITTATDQWFVLTEELEQREFIKHDHPATSKPFVFAANFPSP